MSPYRQSNEREPEQQPPRKWLRRIGSAVGWGMLGALVLGGTLGELVAVFAIVFAARRYVWLGYWIGGVVGFVLGFVLTLAHQFDLDRYQQPPGTDFPPPLPSSTRTET